MNDRNVGLQARIAFILLVAAGSQWCWTPAKERLRFGLDLRGGSEIVYELEPTAAPGIERQGAPRLARDIIERRINYSGLEEAEVREEGTRIVVQLPGADAATTRRVEQVIGQQGRLEFRLTADTQEFPAERMDELAEARDRGDPPPPGYHWYRFRGEGEEGRWDLVSDETLFDGTELERDQVRFGRGQASSNDPRMVWWVAFKFTRGKHAAQTLADVSREWQVDDGEDARRRMAVILNDRRDASATLEVQPGSYTPYGELYSAPKFVSEIPDGDGQITGLANREEAYQLSTVLKSGSLPGILHRLRQDQVGPTLGQDSIRKGMLACAVGLAVVLIFMAVTYTWAGVMAGLALYLNLSLVMATMALLHPPLTLPGIAGLILTMGMSVDANVLVFERIREEILAGRPLSEAMPTGYQRALSAILDSNITTLFTGVILYAFGSGPVRGFAITLCLGIGFSMFTALFVTRSLMEAYVSATGTGRLPMVRWIPVLNWRYLENRRLFYAFSALVIGGSLALMGRRGGGMLGIDFSGGTYLQIRLSSPVTHGEARERVTRALADAGIADRAPRIQPYQEPGLSGNETRSFSVFVRDLDEGTLEKLEQAVTGAFASQLAPEPFGEPRVRPASVRVEVEIAGDATSEGIRAALEEGGITAPRVAIGEPATEGAPRCAAIDVEGAAREEVEATVLRTLGGQVVRRDFRETGRDGERRSYEVRPRTPPRDAAALLQPLRDSFPRLRDLEAVPPAPGSGDPWRLSFSTDRDVAVEATLASSFGLAAPFVSSGSTAAGISFTARLHRALSPADLDERLRGTGLSREGEPREEAGIQAVTLAASGIGLDDAQEKARRAFEQELSDPVPARATRGKQVSADTKEGAFKAILASLLVIVIYVTFRFEFRQGIAATIALVHDVVVTLGVLALFPDATIDLPVVGAILTIIGYSLNDTIVIFDRVRENLQTSGHADMIGVINRSIGQTMGRTVLTATTTLFSVVSLLALGGEPTFSFALALTAGVTAGTYSTVCIACPLILRKTAPRK